MKIKPPPALDIVEETALVAINNYGLSSLAALSFLPSQLAICEANIARSLALNELRELWGRTPLIVVNAPFVRQRLFGSRPFKEVKHFDLLELYAFVRPAQFCAPSVAGLAQALGLDQANEAKHELSDSGRPHSLAQIQVKLLHRIAHALLGELAQSSLAFRLMAQSSLKLMKDNGWAWGEAVGFALDAQPIPADFVAPPPLYVWSLLDEWEDHPPMGQPRSVSLSDDEVTQTLAMGLGRAKLSESRPQQLQFALKASSMFEAKFVTDQPNMYLLEAGTGVGKTLGYLAPSISWAQKAQGQVWVSTYTRALQKQIYADTGALFDTSIEQEQRIVVRKGRENYLCLLNYQEKISQLNQGGSEAILAALIARWVIYSRDGDIIGGDFPSWLPTLIAPSSQSSLFNQLTPLSLIDRRGECIHSACAHYRVCFVEKSIRKSRQADIVIANHALVMAQAAYEFIMPQEEQSPQSDDDKTIEINDAPLLSRLVFDEGHHVFEAADSAFSTQISGFETYEMRRWIRGNEGRGRRTRGLEARLGDLLSDQEEAKKALSDLMRAASALPSEGWSQRLMTQTQSGAAMAAIGPIEALLSAVKSQLDIRTSEVRSKSHYTSEMDAWQCEAYPVLPHLALAAKSAESALLAIETHLRALIRALSNILNNDTDLDPQDAIRLDGALRGLNRRARVQLPSWRQLLQSLKEPPEKLKQEKLNQEDSADMFVDWFSTTWHSGRLVDIVINRHYVDPSVPFADYVLKPAHGVLMASATLSDGAQKDDHDDGFNLARSRTGANHLIMGAKIAQISSPFDYAKQARLYVITDIVRDDVRSVSSALKALFLASKGGGLGLFTAIRRLKSVYEQLSTPLGEAGISLYAQHVDPLDVSDLINIFRTEPHSCLLGTDAVRDGIDVPGEALRLIAFDRVPWPRPDALHKARRAHFGAKTYDDALTRAKLAQAFGRLIRKADDKGVFVMLDSAAPTRLFSSLPQGVVVQRSPLKDVLIAIDEFLFAPP